MTAEDIQNEVAAWRAVALDSQRVGEPAVMLSGRHPSDDSVIIRLGITRQHADELLGSVDLREIDALSEKLVTAACGDAVGARVLLLTVTGLVQSVRNRRLSLFEAEEDLKKACGRLSPEADSRFTVTKSA